MIKMCYIQTMEYHSAIKINEVLIYATTWMGLGNTTENERSHKEPHIVWFHSCEMSWTGKFRDKNIDWWLPGVVTAEGIRINSQHRVFLWGSTNMLEIDGFDGCTIQ